jgi:predicted dehydrogenase
MALQFGLLGTGLWAREVHAAALAASDQADLVGIWGRNPAKARATAEPYGVRAFDRVEELLEAVDAVAFSLPPDVQADLAVRAANAGRHLLLEKPLALSLRAARRVVEAAERNGVASVVFFTARFQPEVAAWLQRVRGGDWYGAHCAWMASIFQPGNPFGESPWRRDKGALWDVGPHALSLLVPALGAVERVTAGSGLGDTVHLVLGHRGGASSTVSLSLTIPPAAPGATELVLYGAPGPSAMPRRDSSPVEAAAEAVRQLAAVVAAGGTAHPCGARFAAEVVAVLEAAEGFLATPVERRSAAVAQV